jgi:L,D-transpeptidase catalytic domain/Putative peptidoglycan binding domain
VARVALKSVSRGGWVAVGAGVLAVASATGFAGEQYVNRVALGGPVPAPGSAIASGRPLIALDAKNVGQMRDLTVLVDGIDRTASAARAADGRLVVPTERLADGTHDVSIRFATSNVFSRSVARRWSFTVDTKLPGLAVTTPKPGAEVNRRALLVTGTTEPNTNLTVGWRGGSAHTVADATGGWQVTADLPEGPVALKLVAADPAGNAAVATRKLTVDTTAPRMTLAKLPAKLTATDAPTFTGTIKGEAPGRAVFGAMVNGREVIARPGAAGVDQNGDPTPGVTITGNQFAMSVGRIPQGKNDVKVFVRDPAGNRNEKPLKLLVDSTDEFGTRDLIAGARGADVKELQQQLRKRGFKRTKVTGVFDAATARGLRNYQRVHDIKQSGVFGQKTRTAFVGRIVVNLSTFRVSVIRDGKKVVTFPIAHGTPRYPTPTGTYRIVNKQADPTWTPPPDSDWAKGLGPIPPGPGNPLGTRWMGTSAPLVGIHGTPAAGTIGTRASHGCIRMRIPDAEALYEEVVVGMPVKISY